MTMVEVGDNTLVLNSVPVINILKTVKRFVRHSEPLFSE